MIPHAILNTLCIQHSFRIAGMDLSPVDAPDTVELEQPGAANSLAAL